MAQAPSSDVLIRKILVPPMLEYAMHAPSALMLLAMTLSAVLVRISTSSFGAVETGSFPTGTYPAAAEGPNPSMARSAGSPGSVSEAPSCQILMVRLYW